MEIFGKKRTQLGKKTKVLRRDRQIPAVVFGKDIDSTNIFIPVTDFKKVLKTAGSTGLINLKFEDFDAKVLIKNYQVHPVTLEPIHASFFKVNLKEKTKAYIPVQIVGEELNALIKAGEAIVLALIDEIEVAALPTDLPSQFTVDVSKIDNFDEGITVADLDFDRSKVEIVSHDESDLVTKLDRAQIDEEGPEIDEETAIKNLEATQQKDVDEKAPEDKD